MIVKDYHSVYDLNYHLVLVTKYRRKVITDAISSSLQSDFPRIGEKYGIDVIEFNHDKDHIHVLFRAKPTTNISAFLNAYKSASSRLVKKNFPEIKEKLWKEFFWNKSYYIATTGGTPLDTIAKYVHNQGGDEE